MAKFPVKTRASFINRQNTRVPPEAAYAVRELGRLPYRVMTAGPGPVPQTNSSVGDALLGLHERIDPARALGGYVGAALMGLGQRIPPQEIATTSAMRRGRPVRAYHGTGRQNRFDEFSTESAANLEQGVFFTSDPNAARQYGMMSDTKGRIPVGRNIPVKLEMTPKNTAVVDLKQILPQKRGRRQNVGWYNPKIVNTAIDAAKKKGKDFVVIRGMDDVGGSVEQIIAIQKSGKVKHARRGNVMYSTIAGGAGATVGAKELKTLAEDE